MGLTLKEICDRVVDEAGLNRPSSWISSSDKTARLAVAVAQNMLLKIQDGDKSWVLATKQHTFSTVDGQAAYDLPADFKSILDRTSWDRANFSEMGAVTYQQWQYIKSSVLSSRAGLRLFQIQADSGEKKFFVDPTPTVDGDSLSFWYKGNDVVTKSGGSEADSPVFTSDSDTCIFPDRVMIEGIKYKMLNRLGLAYIEEMAEFENALTAALATDGAPPDIFIGGGYYDPLIGPDNVPDSGFGGV